MKRVLLAQAGGKWLQAMASPSGVPPTAWSAFQAEFAAAVAGVFGIAAATVTVVEREVADDTDTHAAFTVPLAGGTFESIAVTAAPIKAPLPAADAFRQSLGSIFAGTAAQKRQRWFNVLETMPALGGVLAVLRGGLTDDGKATLFEATTRIKGKIGLPTEVLTATEYDALKALADQHGLGAWVPARL